MSEGLVATCGACRTRYPKNDMRCPKCFNTARKLTSDDPAMILLDNVPRTPKTVHKDGCFICEDDEFARMGMSLCYPCKFCGGHVAADDYRCDVCKKDQPDESS
jgi:hypothetical protein